MWTVIIGALLNFIASSSLSWSSTVIPKLLNNSETPFANATNEQEASWVTSILSLGSCLGVWTFVYFADYCGKKKTFLAMGIIFLVCNLVTTFAKRIQYFYFSRFILGMGTSGTLFLMPDYVAEISSPQNFLRLGAIISIGICGGLLYPNAIGPFVSISILNGTLSILSVIFLVLFTVWGKESSEFHKNKNTKETLIKVNQKHKLNTKIKMMEVIPEKENCISSIFKSKSNRKAIITVNMLLSFQQLSGIDAITYYGQSLFQKFGSIVTAETSIAIVGIFQLLSSFILIVLSKRKVRTLLMISGIGMAFSSVCLSVFTFVSRKYNLPQNCNILSLFFMIFYIVFYNTGFGPLPFILVGKLFPEDIKALATCISGSVFWMVSFLITKNFFSLVNVIGISAYFLICTLISCGATLFVKFYVIETAGRTSDEIQAELNNKS